MTTQFDFVSPGVPPVEAPESAPRRRPAPVRKARSAPAEAARDQLDLFAEPTPAQRPGEPVSER